MASDSFGGRLLGLMGNMTDDDLSVVLKQKYKIVKSKELIKKWRNNDRQPNADAILALSDYFDVPTDWLLGKDVPKTFDADINMICKYTGLSQSAVEALHYATLPEKDGVISDVQTTNKRTVSFINRALDRVNIADGEDGGRRSIETVFSIMEDYVCSTGAWIEDKDNGKRVEFVSVNYGSSEATVFSVRELISSRIKEMIWKTLDALRGEQDALVAASTKKTRKRKHT